MKKICVLTGSRAEYGLLYETIKAIDESHELQLSLVVTGSHLSPVHGLTVNEIKKDNFKIDCEIDIIFDSQNISSIAKSMGILMIQLSSFFDASKPDMLLVLGDRYETMAACCCAVAMNIAIGHIHGGERTEGVMDEQIRHAITKMAHIHFATTEIYRHNIINMGEQAFRVFNVGAPIVENIKKRVFIEKHELESELGICIKGPMFICTYHASALSGISTKKQVETILNALSKYDGTFIFTASNADFEGHIINHMLNQYVKERTNCYFFKSLGSFYLNVCKYADIMIGNSSSGIIEAPCFNLPVVNIGNRQQGRLRCLNVIDAACNINEIRKAIDKALYDDEFKKNIYLSANVYGDGTTSEQIINLLNNLCFDEKWRIKKLEFDAHSSNKIFSV